MASISHDALCQCVDCRARRTQRSSSVPQQHGGPDLLPPESSREGQAVTKGHPLVTVGVIWTIVGAVMATAGFIAGIKVGTLNGGWSGLVNVVYLASLGVLVMAVGSLAWVYGRWVEHDQK